jgi:hypothetical protein
VQYSKALNQAIHCAWDRVPTNLRNKAMLNAIEFIIFVRSRGISSSEAERLADSLQQECPWLSANDEVGEEIGAELIRDAIDGRVLS